ncbi:hypothetical protein QJS65_13970 [Bacillus altitudinis]|uniref:hypothetical protein n=1 Tax=Bacillus altitudinis TaxID=293387 RepID=UPI0024A814A3|nr:hypothetical protein [Bacillus altitudinis]WHF25931.1 hypothetical protein QJS65_13970 [Bacillus altitudinis]
MNIELIVERILNLFIFLEANPKVETTNEFDFRSLIAPLIALIGSIIVGVISRKASNASVAMSKSIGEQNLKALDKNRYIEIVSKNRAKWIEDLRKTMTEYNDSIYLIRIEMIKLVGGEDLTCERIKRLESCKVKIAHHAGKLMLILNPAEIVSKKLFLKHEEIFELLSIVPDDIYEKYNDDIIDKLFLDVVYIENVILKAEWRRLKMEVDEGRELESKEFSKVLLDVAKELDEKRFPMIFT